MTQSATSRKAGTRGARERAAALRRAAEQRQRRRRLLALTGSVGGVVVVVVAIVLAAVLSGGGSSGPAPGASAAAAAARAVAAVPAATLNQIGRGTATTPPVAVKDPPLTSGGLPHVLYVGAEFCPYCAAERWALVQALSRFGTFSNLGATHSSPTDAFANTPTFSFHGSRYASDVVSFKGLELQTVTGQPLDHANAAEAALWHKYTGQPGSYPFLDIAGRYVSTHPSFDPKVLHGLTMQQIAEALSNPSSPVARAVDGSANALTAAICSATGGRPTAVCTTPAVRAFPSASGG